MKISTSTIAKIVVFLVPVALFAFFLRLKLVDPGVYSTVIQEDSLIENLQAVFYFLAFVFASCQSVMMHKRGLKYQKILYALFGFACLLIALEEISWGQRIFQLESPEVFVKYNMQKEISLHNLGWFQMNFLHKSFILVGLYGSFAWLLLAVFNTGDRSGLRLYAPTWYLSTYFFFPLVVYVFMEYSHHIGQLAPALQNIRVGGFLMWRDQEPVELLLSLGMMLFALRSCIWRWTSPVSTVRYRAGGSRNLSRGVSPLQRVN